MKNIKIRLILLLLLIGLIPTTVIWYLSYNSARQSIRAEVLNAMGIYVSLTDSRMVDFFDQKVSDSIVLGRTPEVYQSMEILRDAGWQTATPEWLNRLDILKDYTSLVVEEQEITLILITDINGKVVFTNTGQFWGFDLSGQKYIQEALRGSSSYSDPMVENILLIEQIVVSAPVRADGTYFGEIIGSVNIFFDDDIIGSLVELGETADSYLISADGMILTDTTLGGQEYNASRFDSINTRAVSILSDEIRRGNMGYITTAEYENYMGEMVLGTLKVTRFGHHPVGLVVEVEHAEAFATLNAALFNMLLIGIATAVIVAIVGIVLADRIAKPLQRVADAMPELLRSFMKD